MGEPQAVEARAAACLLSRRADGEPARGHAEDLRADDPALRLGAPAEGRLRERDERPICSTARCASQGVVSLDSICHLDAPRKAAIAPADRGARAPQGTGAGRARGRRKFEHWATPETLDATLDPVEDIVHILNPFDPLVIQRKRLALFFGYEHRFEAYVPKEKRVFGYFAQPVLVGDEIVAVLDLKTDRERRQAAGAEMDLARARTRAPRRARQIEEALHRFERFQLAR